MNARAAPNPTSAFSFTGRGTKVQAHITECTEAAKIQTRPALHMAMTRGTGNAHAAALARGL